MCLLCALSCNLCLNPVKIDVKSKRFRKQYVCRVRFALLKINNSIARHITPLVQSLFLSYFIFIFLSQQDVTSKMFTQVVNVPVRSCDVNHICYQTTGDKHSNESACRKDFVRK